MSKNRITVCESCVPFTNGQISRNEVLCDLRDALIIDGIDTDLVEIRFIKCMNACSDPVSIAFQASGKISYVFAGVKFPDDYSDIASFSRLYLETQSGEIDDARPAGRLRHCLRVRIPAFP